MNNNNILNTNFLNGSDFFLSGSDFFLSGSDFFLNGSDFFLNGIYLFLGSAGPVRYIVCGLPGGSFPLSARVLYFPWREMAGMRDKLVHVYPGVISM